ncbi:MAG: hypothetical protein ACO32I_06255 [Candidatus Limnocylindrus sp.]
MVEFQNLTDHDITIVVDTGDITIRPSGVVLRVDYAPIHARYVSYKGHTIQIVTDSVVRGVYHLPAPKDGVYYIASYAATDYCNKVLGRHDVICPATAQKDRPIKNESGNVVAVRRLRGS